MATGNLLPADYPDSEITLNIENAYSKIQMAAQKTLLAPFVSTDVEFGHVRQLEKNMAAMYCLKAYGPEFLDKITELREEIKEDIDFLKLNIVVDTGDTQILLAVTSYLSIGAAQDEDPDQTTVIPYRSGLTDQV